MLRSACFADVRSSKYNYVQYNYVLLLPHLRSVSCDGKERFTSFSKPKAKEVSLDAKIS